MFGRGKEGLGGGGDSIKDSDRRGGRGDCRTRVGRDGDKNGDGDQDGDNKSEEIDGGVREDGDGVGGTDKLGEGCGPGTGDIKGEVAGGGSHLAGSGPDT